jgi:hypothetical protein
MRITFTALPMASLERFVPQVRLASGCLINSFADKLTRCFVQQRDAHANFGFRETLFDLSRGRIAVLWDGNDNSYDAITIVARPSQVTDKLR